MFVSSAYLYPTARCVNARTILRIPNQGLQHQPYAATNCDEHIPLESLTRTPLMATHGEGAGSKRHRADESLQEDTPCLSPKRVKSAGEHQGSLQYPPEFRDRLSKVRLTRSALKAHERRTSRQPSFPPPRPTTLAQRLVPTLSSELVQCVRDGGPDLSDLRGYPDPTTIGQTTGAMIPERSSRSRATKSTDPTSATSGTTKSKKSRTPYNGNFEQHMIDHGIFPTHKSREPDLGEITAAMAVPRRSLSPSKFSAGAFKIFKKNDARAKHEDDVLLDVVPIICGAMQDGELVARRTVFVNLKPLTDGTISPPNPDVYHGAHPEQLDLSIRDGLSAHIIPSATADKPLAPNFFLEVKGPDGSAAVATRQALYDGAIGARAMHSLQHYGKDTPVYDGNAHTISSTYHAGTLKLYAHHVTEPVTPEGPPEYHMTQVRAFAMTNDRETFVQGATAFRNARDLAKRYRDGLIQTANAIARQPNAQAPLEAEVTVTEVQRHADPTSEAFMDCVDDIGLQVVSVDEGPAVPHNARAEEEESS
ncbi:ASX productUBAD domain-containing protein [Madurella fahalii]|uniref:ASX productUBAD domain-containing protein n=1 Tax=Madurella fahalii TaxID=1157608 RepID=A0ABQ0G6Y5_9PEZI